MFLQIINVLNVHFFFHLAEDYTCKLSKKPRRYLILLYSVQISSSSLSLFANGVFVSRSWCYLLVSFIYSRPNCTLISYEFS